MASVQLLTGGRLEIGLGAGWNGRDYTALGIPFEAPRVRFEKLAEAVAIVDRYLDGDTFSFSGEHYTVTDVEPLATPVRPPLLIAGGGPRLLRLAAKHADIVGIFITSLPDGSGFDDSELKPEVFEAKTQRVRRIARSEGRDPELNVLVQHVDVTDDRSGAAQRRAPEYGCDAETLLGLPFELIGTVDEIVEDLEERRDRYGISYITVYERYLDAMAPVIERLAGN
jgi:probable F420-dependent oxidoreductase